MRLLLRGRSRRGRSSWQINENAAPQDGEAKAPKCANGRAPSHAFRFRSGKKVARLTRELSELLERQTAMSEVLRVISSSSTELAPVFDTILANATRLCDGNFAALWQYDGEALVGVAQHNLSPGFAELCRNTKLWPGPEGAIRKAALERRTIHVADITAELGFSPVVLQYEKARTVLAVPLLRENDLVGIVGIWRREVEPFTEQQIALVRTFADQAVIGIEKRPLAQRAARIAATADRHRRCAQGHQQLTWPTRAGIRCHAGKRGESMRSEVRNPESRPRATASARSPCTMSRVRLPISADASLFSTPLREVLWIISCGRGERHTSPISRPYRVTSKAIDN